MVTVHTLSVVTVTSKAKRHTPSHPLIRPQSFVTAVAPEHILSAAARLFTLYTILRKKAQASESDLGHGRSVDGINLKSDREYRVLPNVRAPHHLVEHGTSTGGRRGEGPQACAAQSTLNKLLARSGSDSSLGNLQIHIR